MCPIIFVQKIGIYFRKGGVRPPGNIEQVTPGIHLWSAPGIDGCLPNFVKSRTGFERACGGLQRVDSGTDRIFKFAPPMLAMPPHAADCCWRQLSAKDCKAPVRAVRCMDSRMPGQGRFTNEKWNKGAC